MVRTRIVVGALGACVLWLAAPCGAQTSLTLQDAVDRALQSRPSLKAEAERVTGAQGVAQQAGAFPNPEVTFQNENLRPGQDYANDVDTLLYFVQPLDVFGKRGGAWPRRNRGWRARALNTTRRDGRLSARCGSPIGRR